MPPQTISLFNLEGKDKQRVKEEKIKQWVESKRPSVFVVGFEVYRTMVLHNSVSVETIQHMLTGTDLVNPSSPSSSSNCLIYFLFQVICDESHKLSLPTQATYKAVAKINTDRRVLLTGTPVQNNLENLYHMSKLIRKNSFGTLQEFQDEFIRPIWLVNQKQRYSECLRNFFSSLYFQFGPTERFVCR